MPHRMILTGKPITPLRKHKQKNIFTFEMREGGKKIAPPKGLPNTEEIYYTVYCNLRQINRAKVDKEKFMDTILVIDGEPTFRMPKNEVNGQMAIITRLMMVLKETGEEEQEDMGEVLEGEFSTESEQAEDREPSVQEIPISSIVIPEEFKKFVPRREKLEAKMEFIRKNKKLEKPLQVRREDYLLLDGYASYLAAAELGMSHVEVLLQD